MVGGLIDNVVLLLALSVLYDYVSGSRKMPLKNILTGVILGTICIGVMFNSFSFTPGVVYDTRSILLGISGLLFDPVSTAVAATMAAAYRFSTGGVGVWAGIATVFATALTGMIWRQKNLQRLDSISMAELYFFGIIIHVVMLSCQLLIPWPKAFEVLSIVLIPVMVIYPVGTAFLGKLMIERNIKLKTKAELDKSRAMLVEVLDSIPHSVFWKDRNSVYQGCNRQFASDLGLSGPAEISGKTDYDLFASKNDSEAYRSDDREVMKSKSTKRDIIEQLTRADGKRIWLSTIKAPLIDANGDLFGVLGLYEDITDRRAAEAELINAKKSAEEASQAKSMFLANMSHEIRTPMNGIVGFAKLLELSKLDDSQKEYVSVINSSSRHLLDIINDILDISRIEAGKTKLEMKELDVMEILSRTFDTFKVAIESKGLSYKISMPAEIDYRVYGDSTRISQMLFNLINNSVKFTEKGYIEAGVEQLEKDGDTALLRFSVSDTGIGIEKEKLSKIFESFFQIDDSYTKKYQGTGLGLAIVKNLANLMGGEVSVKSAAGRGTRFDIDIPFKISERYIYSPDEKISGAGDELKMSAAGMKALIVEDDQISAKLASVILKKNGFEPVTAYNGRQALDLIEKNKFAVVLMDIQLPEIDGLTAIKLIKSRGASEEQFRVPVIALTAYALSGDREKFTEAGADDYISKPFVEEDLTKKIFNLIKKRNENSGEKRAENASK
ncbi:MAG: hypothetical protein A2008_10375 [Candidatus Wallbacteria bacterium GWC2_49_35]|uniref:histidine kinase n=1 Tax=Candidatus Wallbacteria bacterium GWC2_49_35 TaxID=1817813 RepID=A0A1F7WP93_9BACT|nr:MAG: hypothetical protein A2008_10375 [Candidatus Wallbacteria bacterium GWC2_49_35]HBC76601.1 hypothetical protein [Candidatus Wallbacteria bacterium]